MIRGVFNKRINEMLETVVFPSSIYCISCGAIIDQSRNYSLCDECMKSYRWNRGRTCKICGKSLGRVITAAAESENIENDDLPETCYNCMINERSFERGFSCLSYGKNERKPILALKHKQEGYIAKKLGEILYDRLAEAIETEFDGEIPWDLIVPVPVHPERKLSRGYNQAELIAAEVSKRLGVDMDPEALIRVKSTEKMKKLSMLERSLNIEGAFESKKNFDGKTILIIDDVYTSGATMDSCGKALKKAGAKHIHIATIASSANYFKE